MRVDTHDIDDTPDAMGTGASKKHHRKRRALAKLLCIGGRQQEARSSTKGQAGRSFSKCMPKETSRKRDRACQTKDANACSGDDDLTDPTTFQSRPSIVSTTFLSCISEYPDIKFDFDDLDGDEKPSWAITDGLGRSVVDNGIEYSAQNTLTMADFHKYLKEAAHLANEPPVLDKNGVRVVFRPPSDECPVCTLNTRVSLPFACEDVIFMLQDGEMRVDWDPPFQEFTPLTTETVKWDCGVQFTSNLMYSKLAAPFPCKPRDFVQWQSVVTGDQLRSTGAETDCTMILALKSCEHPDYPEKDACARARTYFSGYMVTATPTGCDLCIVSTAHLGGSIPGWLQTLAQRLAVSRPIEWTKLLTQALRKRRMGR